MQDKLSLESLFQDTLSWIYSTALAATLEKIQIVPSIRTVRFLLKHGKAPVIQ
jgi:hypothetical protein